MMRKRLLPLIFFLSHTLVSLWAQELPNIHEGRNVDVEILHNYSTSKSTFYVVAKFDIKPKWHIYWKNPGTTGIPTTIEWALPDNFELKQTYYQTPKYYNNDGIVDYIYEEEAVVVFEIANTTGSEQPFTLNSSVNWLECNNVCMPGSANLSISIDPQKPTEFPANLSKSIENIIAHSTSAIQGEYSSGPEGLSIAIPVHEGISEIESAYFFSHSPIVDASTKQQVTFNVDQIHVTTKVSEYTEELKNVESGLLQLTDASGTKTWLPVSLSKVSQLSGLEGAESEKASNIWVLLLLAYIGGLILNLMPCVFPVIGLKIMGFVEQAGQDSKKIMIHGLVFAAGVIVSFWVLSGLLLILRSGGEQLGWGFQLQEPWFNYALIILLLAFALSLNGVFEFGISAIGAGSKLQQKKGMSGSFFSGVLATVVATPCSAPFLAPALGAALALNTAQSLLVFTFIAIGLSTPYLLLSMFPSVLNKMPRPGAWMETFKQFMAFPLYGTVAYLIWAIFGQIDDSNQFNLLLSLVGIAMALWIYGRWAVISKPKRTRIKATIAALLVIILSIFLGHPKQKKSFWEEWSPELVEKYVNEGKTVYVDFTARWCATCQLNKRVVFSSNEVLKTFEDKNVVALKADWTNRDERITVRLRELDKAAVPVNLVYKKGENEPVILPEVLTPKIVMNALK